MCVCVVKYYTPNFILCVTIFFNWYKWEDDKNETCEIIKYERPSVKKKTMTGDCCCCCSGVWFGGWVDLVKRMNHSIVSNSLAVVVGRQQMPEPGNRVWRPSLMMFVYCKEPIVGLETDSIETDNNDILTVPSSLKLWREQLLFNLEIK